MEPRVFESDLTPVPGSVKRQRPMKLVFKGKKRARSGVSKSSRPVKRQLSYSAVPEVTVNVNEAPVQALGPVVPPEEKMDSENSIPLRARRPYRVVTRSQSARAVKRRSRVRFVSRKFVRGYGTMKWFRWYP